MVFFWLLNQILMIKYTEFVNTILCKLDIGNEGFVFCLSKDKAPWNT